MHPMLTSLYRKTSTERSSFLWVPPPDKKHGMLEDMLAAALEDEVSGEKSNQLLHLVDS